MTKNTKKRLYFTCPIQALYMYKEFGVRFEESELHDLKFEIKESFTDVYYIAKESESIFEPKKGDQGIASDDDVHNFPVKYHSEWNACGIYFDETEAKIIMRNNRHFFSPEVEDE